MGNRSYLYVRAGGEHHEIAEANNNIPVLWQLMLAGGRSGEAIRDQRILRVADEDLDNLEVPLAGAVQRAQHVLRFIARHPVSATLPQVPRYAEAAQAHLQQLLDTHGADATLSADFDEMSWFESDCGEEGFNARYLARLDDEFSTLWQAIDNAIARQDWRAFDRTLAEHFDPQAIWSRDWSQWQWHVGLSSFSHRYFGEYHLVQEADFATYCAQGGARDDEGEESDDDESSDTDERAPDGATHLIGDLWCFGTHGERPAYGVRRGPSVDAPVLITPRYDEIFPLDKPDGEYAYLLCCQRDGKQWLVDTRVTPARVLHDTGYDEIWGFDDEGFMPFQLGKRFGFLRPDGSELSATPYDDVHGFTGGMAAVLQNGRYGFINPEGRQIIAPGYLEVELVDAVEGRHLRRVRLNTGWGVMERDGSLLVPCLYDELTWAHAFEGWLAERAGQWSLLRADGSPWGGPAPYRVENWLADGAFLRIEQDGRYGLLAADGTMRVPCRYTELEMMYGCVQPLLVGCREADGLVELIDEHGVLQLPEPCRRVDMLRSLRTDLEDGDTWRDLLRVERDGPGGDPVVGIWRIGAAAPLVPCVYMDIRVVMPEAGRIVFLTGRINDDDPDAVRMGVRDESGAELYPEVYGPIAGEGRLPSDPWSWSAVGKNIEDRWRQGLPAKAWHTPSQRLVWIDAQGGSEPFEARLRRLVADGDCDAAFELAKARVAGQDVAQDVHEAARLYTHIAQAPHAAQALRGQAAYRLALLLCDTTLDLVDEAAGFHWFQQAAAWLEDGASRRHTFAWLIYLHDTQRGGAQDDPAAVLRYATLASESGDGEGSRRAGVCWRYGHGCEADLDRARALFELAIEQRCAPAHAWLAETLSELAALRDAPSYYGLCVYHLRAALEAEDAPSWTGTLLAKLSLDGKLTEPLADTEALLLGSAEAGDVDAMRLLAQRIYPEGDARQRDWLARWRTARTHCT